MWKHFSGICTANLTSREETHHRFQKARRFEGTQTGESSSRVLWFFDGLETQQARRTDDQSMRDGGKASVRGTWRMRQKLLRQQA